MILVGSRHALTKEKASNEPATSFEANLLRTSCELWQRTSIGVVCDLTGRIKILRPGGVGCESTIMANPSYTPQGDLHSFFLAATRRSKVSPRFHVGKMPIVVGAQRLLFNLISTFPYD